MNYWLYRTVGDEMNYWLRDEMNYWVSKTENPMFSRGHARIVQSTILDQLVVRTLQVYFR